MHRSEPPGSPGGAKTGCPCVLSFVWSERNPAHSSFCLGPGAGWPSLAPHGRLSGHEKVVPGSDSTFLGSILEFCWHMGKFIFLSFDHILVPQGRSQGSPGGAKSGFLCVLSSVWGERNPAHAGLCLGPGPGWRSLAPHGGLSGHKKVVSGSDLTFLGSILEF